MFKRMFNAAKDLSGRPEPEASPAELDSGTGAGEDELFAGMNFAQDVAPEESGTESRMDTGSSLVQPEPNVDSIPTMAEADEGLFSGLSMVSDPLTEVVDSVSERAGPDSEETPAVSADQKGSLASESKLSQDPIAPRETRPFSPPIGNASTAVGNLGQSMSGVPKPPTANTFPRTSLESNPASAIAALRPAVVRKKKRSMRVGYAREGDSEDGAKSVGVHLPQMSTPSDGTPMSQSPRSSIGDVSDLQSRGREDEGGHIEHPKQTGEERNAGQRLVAAEKGDVNVRQGERDAGSESGTGTVLTEEGVSELDEAQSTGVSELDEVQSKGLIAQVLKGEKTEPSEKEEEAARQAAEHMEKEREAKGLDETGAANEVQAESRGAESEQETGGKTSADVIGENASPDIADSADSKLVKSDTLTLPTAASIERVTTEEGEVAAETIASDLETGKGALRRLETDLDIERIALEEQLQEEEAPTVESLGALPLPEQVAQVRQYVEKRLAIVREKVAAGVATKKAAVAKKREAAERVAEAAALLVDLEAKVMEASEQEEFEKAEELTKQIEDVEKDAAAATAAARAAEAESDSASAQVQSTAQEEVDIELAGASLLRAVIASAYESALRVQQSAEAAASEREASLQQQEDDVAERRRKVGLELRVIEEENATLRLKIDESTREEVAQKQELLEVKGRIEAELQELRAKVAEKERELTEQEEKVAGVEGKIAVVAAKFGRELKGLQTDEERVSLLAAQLEAELELVAEERRRVAAAVEDATNARQDLERTAARAELDAAKMEGQAKRKQGAAAAAVASQKRKEALAEEEKKLHEEAEALRARVGVLRSSFQEVAVVKLRLQQELAAEEHKVEAADKRSPELEAEKKLAAQARNFKEAARLSGEAKALAAERERAEAEAGRLRGELGAAENDERGRAEEMAELEKELAAKEKEAATARCERLRLVAAAARREMDEAAEAEDFEEAGSLQAEAESADAEAEQLKATHGLEGARFEVVEHVGGEEGDVSGEGDVSKNGDVSKDGDGGHEGLVSPEEGISKEADSSKEGGVSEEGRVGQEGDVSNGGTVRGESTTHKVEAESKDGVVDDSGDVSLERENEAHVSKSGVDKEPAVGGGGDEGNDVSGHGPGKEEAGEEGQSFTKKGGVSENDDSERGDRKGST